MFTTQKKVALQPWSHFVAQADHLADYLGKGLDAGIKPVVIALRASGFSTNASCEGHLKWGEPAPWIDIGEEPSREQYSRYFKPGRKNQTARNRIGRTLSARNFPQLLRLYQLLNEFYRTRRVPFSQRLIATPFGEWYGGIRLTNQGANVQRALPLAQQKRRLKQYRAEFSAFTNFLKRRWNQQNFPRLSRSAALPTNPHPHARTPTRS